MSPSATLFGGLLLLLAAPQAAGQGAGADPLRWDELPSLPNSPGVAGAFSGVSGGALIVAGGANFPSAPPWEGGGKLWQDDVFVLEEPGDSWRRLASALPRPLAYGVAVTHDDRLVIAGGGDAERHHAQVLALRWTEGRLETEELPSMPGPLAFSQGALVGDWLLICGGTTSPDATRPAAVLWRLDLGRAPPERAWEVLEPCPGPTRMLAVAGALAGELYLFGGTDLSTNEAGDPVRIPLTDAWRHRAGAGWKRLADLPRPAIAAPSPAPALGQSHLLVLGGDDGRHLGQDLRDEHPGFSRETLAYHSITDTWRSLGQLPHSPGPGPASASWEGVFPPVTTHAVWWNGRLVLPSGEVRPGVRTARVLTASVEAPVRGLAGLDKVVLALYFAVLVGMGAFFARRGRSTEDFFLGGKRIPWWAAGASVFGTQLSAITFMAIPAKSFATDWVFFVGSMTIPLVAPLVVFFYLPFFRRHKLTTAYEYLELRFGYATRALGSASYLLFQLGRMGIVLFLPALALEAVTGVPVHTCILLMGALATTYAVLGGIEAVIWTDVLQVVVLLGGAALSLVIIGAQVDGGLGGVVQEASAAGKLHWANLDWGIAGAALWVVLLGNVFNTLVSYTSDQSVVQRYLTTSSERDAARSIWTNAFLTIPSSLLFFGIGTALWAFYRQHPGDLNPAGRNDEIFPWFVAAELPIGVAGLVIAGLFAAAMSSLDSSMNSMATAITTDFYRRLVPDASERRCLWLARVLTALLGILGTGAALFLASLDSTSMFDQYLKVIGLFGGGLAGLFAAGVFLRSVTGPGAIAGFVASAGVLALVQRSDSVHFLLYACIGVLTACGVGWLASWVLPARPRPLAGLTLATLNEEPERS